MGIDELIDQWRKVLVTLESVRTNQEGLEAMKNAVSGITTNLDISQPGDFPRIVHRRKQRLLAIRLQSALDDLHEDTDQLDRTEKDVRVMCKQFYVMQGLRDQVRASSARMVRRFNKLRKVTATSRPREFTDAPERLHAPAKAVVYDEFVESTVPLDDDARRLITLKQVIEG